MVRSPFGRSNDCWIQRIEPWLDLPSNLSLRDRSEIQQLLLLFYVVKQKKHNHAKRESILACKRLKFYSYFAVLLSQINIKGVNVFFALINLHLFFLSLFGTFKLFPWTSKVKITKLLSDLNRLCNYSFF